MFIDINVHHYKINIFLLLPQNLEGIILIIFVSNIQATAICLLPIRITDHGL